MIFALLCIAPALWLLRRSLPLFAPFLPALAAAAVMEPAVSGLCRRGVRRSMAAGLVTTAGLTLCLAVILLCAMGGSELVTSYGQRLPQLLVLVTDTTHTIRHGLEGIVSSLPKETAVQLYAMMNGITAQLQSIPSRLSQQALEGVTVLAKASPDGLLFLCTAVIGVYFFSLYYRELGHFFRRQLSEAASQRVSMIGTAVREAVGGYLKVQCILSGVTFLILSAAFSLMGIGNSLPTAAVIAILDALPILGAGAVLLPWALICLILGNVSRAIGLLTVYGLLLVVRNVLQAKLMGSSLGLHPLAALVSLYAGWQLAGLLGMIGLPMVCVVLRSLNDAGILKLYQ